MLKRNKVDTAISLNLAINNIIKSKLKKLIEQKLGVEVCDILFDSSLETQYTGAIVIFSQLPTVRPLKAIAKIHKNQRKNEYIDESNFNQAYRNSNLAVIMLYFLCLETDKDMQPDIYLWKIGVVWINKLIPKLQTEFS